MSIDRDTPVSFQAEPAVWFPAIKTGTGTDVFTQRLCDGLNARGVHAEITWLPLRTEYMPWMVPVPQAPGWVNVVHVNTWLPVGFIPRKLPVVATVHHAVHHPDARAYKGVVRSNYHRWWIAPNERRVLRRANYVTAVSNYVAETTRKTLVDVPMQVIHNGVDTEIFTPGVRQRQAGEPFRLLYVGSWMARKGVDLLAPIMRELGDGFVLHYTGGPAARREHSSMPANMIDIGRLHGEAAVVAAMQDAHAFLFPSRSEGHPLAGIEAMACGLPVIGMHGSSVAEAVTDGRTGLMCPHEDVSAFVEAIRRLAADKLLQATLADAARMRVVESFSQNAVLDAHMRLYEAAVNGIVKMGADKNKAARS